jgi:aspartate carbamoyltransferase regulatory subunit
MALILKLLADKSLKKVPGFTAPAGKKCRNPKCISVTEPTLPQMINADAGGTWHCYYCDSEVN